MIIQASDVERGQIIRPVCFSPPDVKKENFSLTSSPPLPESSVEIDTFVVDEVGDSENSMSINIKTGETWREWPMEAVFEVL